MKIAGLLSALLSVSFGDEICTWGTVGTPTQCLWQVLNLGFFGMHFRVDRISFLPSVYQHDKMPECRNDWTLRICLLKD